jgi:hypothetical protein
MRALDGEETDTICKELGITSSNVWVMLHRARSALRKCLELNWIKEINPGTLQMVRFRKFLIKLIMPVMSRLIPTCGVVSQKVSESMDHPLSLPDRIRVRLHLMGCALCARYEKQLLAMRRMLELHADDISESPDVKLSDDARRRMKQELTRNH